MLERLLRRLPAPWWVTRRRLVRMIAEAHDRAFSTEALADADYERRALADMARLGRVLADEDTRRSPSRLAWLAEHEQDQRRAAR